MAIIEWLTARPASRIAVGASALVASAWLLTFAGADATPSRSVTQTPPVTASCPPLVVDVHAGTVNGMGPATPLAKVMRRLPCFTGQSVEGELFNYGGGVFYRDHNLYFYTYLRFIEVREPFNGSLRPQIFGRSRSQLASEFLFNQQSGRPSWGRENDEFVTTAFGCIQFTFAGDRVYQMRFFSRGCDLLYQPR